MEFKVGQIWDEKGRGLRCTSVSATAVSFVPTKPCSWTAVAFMRNGSYIKKLRLIEDVP